MAGTGSGARKRARSASPAFLPGAPSEPDGDDVDLDDGADDEFFEVECILDSDLRHDRHGRLFESALVKWVGYEEPSWEPMDELRENAADIVDVYFRACASAAAGDGASPRWPFIGGSARQGLGAPGAQAGGEFADRAASRRAMASVAAALVPGGTGLCPYCGKPSTSAHGERAAPCANAHCSSVWMARGAELKGRLVSVLFDEEKALWAPGCVLVAFPHSAERAGAGQLAAQLAGGCAQPAAADLPSGPRIVVQTYDMWQHGKRSGVLEVQLPSWRVQLLPAERPAAPPAQHIYSVFAAESVRLVSVRFGTGGRWPRAPWRFVTFGQRVCCYDVELERHQLEVEWSALLDAPDADARLAVLGLPPVHEEAAAHRLAASAAAAAEAEAAELAELPDALVSCCYLLAHLQTVILRVAGLAELACDEWERAPLVELSPGIRLVCNQCETSIFDLHWACACGHDLCDECYATGAAERAAELAGAAAAHAMPRWPPQPPPPPQPQWRPPVGALAQRQCEPWALQLPPAECAECARSLLQRSGKCEVHAAIEVLAAEAGFGAGAEGEARALLALARADAAAGARRAAAEPPAHAHRFERRRRLPPGRAVKVLDAIDGVVEFARLHMAQGVRAAFGDWPGGPYEEGAAARPAQCSAPPGSLGGASGCEHAAWQPRPPPACAPPPSHRALGGTPLEQPSAQAARGPALGEAVRAHLCARAPPSCSAAPPLLVPRSLPPGAQPRRQQRPAARQPVGGGHSAMAMPAAAGCSLGASRALHAGGASGPLSGSARPPAGALYAGAANRFAPSTLGAGGGAHAGPVAGGGCRAAVPPRMAVDALLRGLMSTPAEAAVPRPWLSARARAPRPVNIIFPSARAAAELGCKLNAPAEGRAFALPPVAGLSQFASAWRRAEPVVCPGGHVRLRQLWTPETLVSACGDEAVQVVDCCGQGATLPSMPLGHFFEGYMYAEARATERGARARRALKLRDWPSSAHFRHSLPAHFADLMAALPFKLYTHARGELNLAAHLPDALLAPDLGPKLYAAYGRRRAWRAAERVKGGHTCLHSDVADAFNLLVHTHTPPDEPSRPPRPRPRAAGGAADPELAAELEADPEEEEEAEEEEEGLAELSSVEGAVWDIYAHEDSDKICTYLRARAARLGQPPPSHPIHDHCYYLDAEMRRELREQHGVVGWRFVQRLGDFVLIPAGCAHQVRNLSGCIKVAMDFVSPESAGRCLDLAEEFRALPSAHHLKGDKLQAKATVWYAAMATLTRVRQESMESSMALASALLASAPSAGPPPATAHGVLPAGLAATNANGGAMGIPHAAPARGVAADGHRSYPALVGSAAASGSASNMSAAAVQVLPATSVPGIGLCAAGGAVVIGRPIVMAGSPYLAAAADPHHHRRDYAYGQHHHHHHHCGGGGHHQQSSHQQQRLG